MAVLPQNSITCNRHFSWRSGFTGWQFAQTGWGKMHNIAKITGFLMSLNIPFPAFSACFISGLEFFGGLLLILARIPPDGLLAGCEYAGSLLGGRTQRFDLCLLRPGKVLCC
jgi:hypothetical protein